ncbi:hypothetical protein VNO80_13353 [Phaseolus coccineus]|uniref:Uncharacterized protein n=1 Tax=Phaseolus coccineus TaxID=3886 RepID=A0AAN9N6I8_PHACN
MRVVENSKESKQIEKEEEIVFESEFEYNFEDYEILPLYRLDDDFNANSTSNETNSTPNETFVASESHGYYVKSILNLDGQGFLPSCPAVNGIGDILRSHYTDPLPSWKNMPIRVRDLWFGELLVDFI